MNRVIITGGGGFVGRKIVQLLCEEGVQCAVIGRNRYFDLEDQGVECYQGDIRDRSFVIQHLKDADVVFHVAALAGIWGNWQNYSQVNITGTQNVVDGCIQNNIPVLVHTSTPSVVFDRNDIIEGDENLPFPQKYLCNYAKSKAVAEKIVLSVDQRILRTCAIRPHLIWGPGDPHLIPRLLARGRSGDLKIVGDGTNIVDITYIDNVGLAHILAAKELLLSVKCCGKAYFIGQERPVQLWGWINELFKKVGIEPITNKISLPAALVAGTILEKIHLLFKSAKEPKMTRFLAEQLARSHCFSHDRAKRDFGYAPHISIEVGMERLIHWLEKS